ncbi:unnamed protein product [Effrenium voratum]|uniref:RING-type domain-containing protein n=1 Tax=Effrenium voratum TaxID=2562239 RepID=A0AA36MLI7_9DINO|nr:unnamed protein product [Effrenium voratum]CAJ1371627.1 unnamed protein product [Effrenium voratum]CAJ1431965.1 unnamed protein product [Effrenium voratum]|mmetsp:Transcript_47381/g.112661  ORF Transcript_47381/g.112661 Transcript_47381/m.112661 type:complete len:471 (+) Transcript_47381:162-1574(+)
MRSGRDRETEPVPGVRRRAGSCPPHGRGPPAGPALNSATRSAIRSGLMAAGSQFRGSDLGLGAWPYLAAGLGSNITARIVSTDRGNLDLSNRPAGVPGTLQLTVLVPVLLNTPRRTQEDVAGIGTTWTLGDAEVTVQPAILSKLKLAEEEELDEDDQHCEEAVSSSSGLCDSCGICLQPFQPGDNLTALPCATDICPSVWHAECVRKWLCQGHTPTCPLCRAAMDLGDSGAQAGPSFALEVRAALPLSATSGLQAAFSSGRGTSNQLLQQLGQVIIQDILLLTLSQHTGGTANLGSPSPHLASSGLLNGATGDASTALADLGGLLLRTLTTNGTLPVTLSAVETWGPGPNQDSPRHAMRPEAVWKGRGRGGRGGKGRGGKGGKAEPRGASWRRGNWNSHDEEASSSASWHSRPRQVWVPVNSSRQGQGKGSGKGASNASGSNANDSRGRWSSSSWNSWNGWNHWDGGTSR